MSERSLTRIVNALLAFLLALVLASIIVTTGRAAPLYIRQDIEAWADAYAWWYANDRYSHDELLAHTLAVAACESIHFDIRVINGTRLGALGEVGVGQFHPRGIWWATPQAKAGYSMYDVEANVAALTWSIANGYGPRHWRACW